MTMPPHVQAQADQMMASISSLLDQHLIAFRTVAEKFGRDAALGSLATVLTESPFDSTDALHSALIVAIARLAEREPTS